MITITREYLSAKIKKQEGSLLDVITSVYCVCKAYDEETGFQETSGLEISLEPPTESQFVPFNELTKQEVDSWVIAKQEYQELESRIISALQDRLNIDTKELPWNIVEPPAPVTVPLSVTPLQIRMAINQMGLRESVETYVQTLTQSEKDAWEYATAIERTNPILVNGAAALGKTEEDLDNLFMLALTLV